MPAYRTVSFLSTCFPIPVFKESGPHTSHREPGNRDNDFENRKQGLKVLKSHWKVENEREWPFDLRLSLNSLKSPRNTISDWHR
jgi:hypothetical protein